jgi:hypothetical protein
VITKLLGILIVCFWVASMSWLVARDVWPALSAQEVPVIKATRWLESEGRKSQAGIFDGADRIGTIWTTYIIDEAPAPREGGVGETPGSPQSATGAESIIREDIVILERFALPITPLMVSAYSTFNPEGELDEFTLNIKARDTRMKLHGERFHTDFSFWLKNGQNSRDRMDFKLPLSEAGTISGAFNPFTQLADLQVGQSWRMQVFNPVAALTGVGDRFIPMLARVTRQENITVRGVLRTCLVVEAPGAKAWVDRRGVVLRQEMALPVGGTLTVVREPFDEKGRDAARSSYFTARTRGGL